jgi:hypothetical protein
MVLVYREAELGGERVALIVFRRVRETRHRMQRSRGCSVAVVLATGKRTRRMI